MQRESSAPLQKATVTTPHANPRFQRNQKWRRKEKMALEDDTAFEYFFFLTFDDGNR